MHELALILDFGSQYTQLIAKEIRKLEIYSEIIPCTASYEEIIAKKPKAIILSGSPYSVNSPDAPKLDMRLLDGSIPILGICYGMQLITKLLGGNVAKSDKKEFGYAQINITNKSNILADLSDSEQVWMSHGDAVTSIPNEFETIASTSNSPFAAIAHKTKKLYALQFHAEVAHTPNGKQIFENFLLKIAGFSGDWTVESFVESSIKSIREQVGDDQVILGLSGGVDSSVVAALIYKAIGKQLIPIFVNHGLLRKNEVDEVERFFNKDFGMEIVTVHAEDIFLSKLAGITDPEQKRKIIGATFIEIFDREAQKHANAKWLAQGTVYPDVIESVSFKGPSATIKSHHNVGGLPEKMNLKLIEPLRELFKDEVRAIGEELGLPHHMVHRHPFPGPGLAIRIIGDITADKVALLQNIDAIFIEELHSSGLYEEVWQAFSVLLPIHTVGVMGDERTYDQVCALRAVTSVDGMTADWAELPFDFLKKVSSRIINEVKGVNRVCYDISSKPPATIEWE
ncbi:MAG: glutamine-hydrolyzing GMP synthase [Candidatus Cloacimonadales bacterium]|jgi:GMP synthase (glutamine-hydrolysing)|nr:glutamine-hydrolyzing GMP synthase [Candidatus Cloacimonadota bacterium]MDX9977734.1 glutamine-hydrolyzing GMP synthase [Candidatus Cloacimonadales bacterium]